MNKIYIYVESKSDKEFLDCYLRHLGKDSKHYEIIPNGSNAVNAKYKSGQTNLFAKIKSHKDNEEQVLIIFDTDKNFVQTQKRIIKESQGLMTTQEIFLFPNNSDNGELETLLLEIARNKKPCECFKCYIDCLGDLKDNVFKKSPMFAYREAMGAEKKIKDKKETKILQVEFERIFDFESSALEPLKSFIEKAFKSDKGGINGS